MEACPCGNEIKYEDCCGSFHSKKTTAPTAEKLMRSRYSAFVKNQIKYIGDTHIPGTSDFDEQEASDWATKSTWKKLEIVDTEKGLESDEDGMVEFKAFYSDEQGKDFVHHEVAKFQKVDGVWLYADGQVVGTGTLKRVGPKIGRNDPCPCGSGKKYKKCCGKN